MNALQAAAVVGLAVALVGCATVKETYAPDGRKAFALNCSGAARGWDKCFAAAGEICKDAGYDILDRRSEGEAFSAAQGSFNNQGGNLSASSAKTNARSMVVACKRN